MEIKKYIQKPEGAALISALAAGVLTHLFALTNVLHNYDDIVIQPNDYGWGLPLGRWLLNVLGGRAISWFGNYDLPLVNGLMLIAMVAVAAAFFVAVFQLSAKGAVCVGIVFAVAPAVTSTMFFRFLGAYYGLAILLAVLAVWFLEKFKWGLIPAVLCIAMSMGIYQADVPLTIGMFVLLLIRETLRNETHIGKLIGKGFYDCAAIALGALVYFGILRFMLNRHDMQMMDYQGVSGMGKFGSVGEILALVKAAVLGFVKMPLTNFCGLAQTKLVTASYLLLAALTLIGIIYVLATKVRKLLPTIFTAVLLMFFALAVNFIVVMVPNGSIYTLMTFPYVLALCAPLVLWELVEIPKRESLGKGLKLCGAAMVSLTLFISMNYGYQANANYTALHYANCQTENYLNSLVVQVRMTEGFTADKEWALLGDIQDPLLYSPWERVPKFGGNATTEGLLNAYSRISWINNYFGYQIPSASPETAAQLAQTEQVRAMPCWPDEGSIAVVDNVVVVKFQELVQ